MLLPWLASAALPCLATVQLGYWLAWGGSLALSIALVALMWTRWGQSQPLQKCAALSLLVHLILAFLTMTVRIVSGDGGGGGGPGVPIRVRLVQAPAGRKTPATTLPKRQPAAEVAAPQPLAPAPPTPEKLAEEKPAAPTPKIDPEKPAEAIAPTLTAAANAPQVADTAEPVPPSTVANKPSESEPGPATAPAPGDLPAAAAGQPGTVAAGDTYSLRNASDRLSLTEGQGGNAKTEAAVVAALNWLVASQSPDGRWSATKFGAGQEQMVLGQDRGGAGRNADTGISALALLAFLGAGHSHTQGEYRETVHRGIDFLLRSQAADGNLFGNSTLYAQMYCHSMATFALAEAQAISGDRRLEAAVTKAVHYSLAAQNAGTGGWRYRPGDSGDTSQMGWQIMSLASARRAGVRIPDQTWNRIDRFLRSVRRGNFGGLASYRPDSPFSTSMTAESLYCHLVLEEMNGLHFAEPAANEATNQILTVLPTAERVNLYYWYYASLALHHRQPVDNSAAVAWRAWNEALTTALLSTQVTDGDQAGSWNTNCLWGGYGGRVYTTALAAMCLEVYYRYAPAPSEAQRWTNRPEARPASR